VIDSIYLCLSFHRQSLFAAPEHFKIRWLKRGGLDGHVDDKMTTRIEKLTLTVKLDRYEAIYPRIDTFQLALLPGTFQLGNLFKCGFIEIVCYLLGYRLVILSARE
jgi:hypothetical protein